METVGSETEAYAIADMMSVSVFFKCTRNFLDHFVKEHETNWLVPSCLLYVLCAYFLMIPLSYCSNFSANTFYVMTYERVIQEKTNWVDSNNFFFLIIIGVVIQPIYLFCVQSVHVGMKYVKSDVYTVNCGMAYGQAAMLLALGAKGYRAVQPNSSSMVPSFLYEVYITFYWSCSLESRNELCSSGRAFFFRISWLEERMQPSIVWRLHPCAVKMMQMHMPSLCID